MLWYKCWREMRNVMLVGVASMAVACVMIVHFQQAMRNSVGVPTTYIAYVWKSVYDSLGRDVFLIMTLILGSGGLLQEKSQVTVGFTLSLPVSRKKILWMRALMGYAGVLALSLTPAVVMPVASRMAGLEYPVMQALGFSALWAGVGAVFYGYTFFLAQRLEGEHTALLLAVPSLMLYGVAAELPWLAKFPLLNIFDVITGEEMPYFNERIHMLTGALPWLALASMVLVAAGAVEIGARRMQAKDFA